MTSREFRERLGRRLQRTDVALPNEHELTQLEAYFQLLKRWNQKINLTALPLDKPTEEMFDRLFAEPLAAARHFPSAGSRSGRWYDLGTGGGSPAVPLKIVVPGIGLTMVESKVRKAAFLREVVRTLELADTDVENDRFEQVALRLPRTAQLVTVRAVRPDGVLRDVATTLLKPGGQLLLFGSTPKLSALRGLEAIQTVQLAPSPNSFLAIYRREA